MNTYIYKVKSKFMKKREDGTKEIEKYFRLYTDEEEVEEIYSIPYVFRPDSKLVRTFVNTFNSSDWQSKFGVEDDAKRAELEKIGLVFIWDANSNKWVLDENEDTLYELGKAMICVDAKEEEIKNVLFVCVDTEDGQGGSMSLFNSLFLDDAKEVIDALLREGVIYKALSPVCRRRREARKRKINNLA